MLYVGDVVTFNRTKRLDGKDFVGIVLRELNGIYKIQWVNSELNQDITFVTSKQVSILSKGKRNEKQT